ncbi:hypothetical protein G8759_27425 [Spirosoma aureum]|uniref:Uncharacterized protein n=1 Tax=Spirosoma aureum TaxID=2692134 RepID=A0A6G9AUF3_9BACT|nr:hypothetical protein [Spirosoma aureum]QIP16101.1 hypothetical protein G8759_27425 [Spirosoma aureum]
MTVAEEKIKVIEKVLETDDAHLLREVASLLNIPSLSDYPGQPMSMENFLGKIERAEEAARQGEVTDHEDVKKLIATWSKK